MLRRIRSPSPEWRDWGPPKSLHFLWVGGFGMDRRETQTYVTVPEAARRSGLGLRQFRRAIESGELAVFDVGRWPRLRWSEVVGWIEGTRRLTRGSRSQRQQSLEASSDGDSS